MSQPHFMMKEPAYIWTYMKNDHTSRDFSLWGLEMSEGKTGIYNRNHNVFVDTDEYFSRALVLESIGVGTYRRVGIMDTTFWFSEDPSLQTQRFDSGCEYKEVTIV